MNAAETTRYEIWRLANNFWAEMSIKELKKAQQVHAALWRTVNGQSLIVRDIVEAEIRKP